MNWMAVRIIFLSVSVVPVSVVSAEVCRRDAYAVVIGGRVVMWLFFGRVCFFELAYFGGIVVEHHLDVA